MCKTEVNILVYMLHVQLFTIQPLLIMLICDLMHLVQHNHHKFISNYNRWLDDKVGKDGHLEQQQ